MHGTSSNTAVLPSLPLEYLVFTIGSEEYGVDIQKVQELRGCDAVTRIANSPAYIKGVINLRGRIVPIIDLRLKLGFNNPRYDEFTVVIILTIGDAVMGMVVDSVSDVITLTESQIKPTPGLGHAVKADYVLGIGTADDRMLILVDMEPLISSSDLTHIDRLAA